MGSIPPTKDNVVEVPEQTVIPALLFTEVGASQITGGITFTVTETQAVLLHTPSALTKYVVVICGVTISDEPEPIDVPPHEVVYHFQEAPVPRVPPFTFKVTGVPGAILSALAPADEATILGKLNVRFKVAILSHPATFVVW